MIRQAFACALALGGLLAMAATPCYSQSALPAGSSDQALISAGALEGLHGRTAVNVAAGTGNLQANAMSMAVGDAPQSVVQARQDIEGRPTPSAGRDASSTIEAGAFRNLQGAISVNVASGEFNRQANLISISVSGLPGSGASVAEAAASDDVLLNSRAGPAPTDADPARQGQRSAQIEAGAFAGTSGIVQINQVAGIQNTVSNLVVIRVSGHAGAL